MTAFKTSGGPHGLGWSVGGIGLAAALLLTTAVYSQQGRSLISGLTGTPLAVRTPAPKCGAAPPSLRAHLPWQPYLTDEEVQRAEGYYGTGARLQRVAAKLLAGKPIQVFTLGGSVTRGLGASTPERNYASRFFSLLNATFPHAGHVFANKGIGGTSSGVFAACATQLVPPGADLVVVEFTYNEPDDAPFASPPRRGFEQLLRSLLRLPGAPALVMLHHYAWWYTHGDGLRAGLYYRPAEAQLQTLANYYDMPAVSMRNVLWPLMNAGVDGFRADGVSNGLGHTSPLGVEIPAAPAGREESYYYHDRTHPSDRGHAMMAEALAGPLGRALAAAAAAGGGAPPGRRRLDPLAVPPPMVPGNDESPSTLCAMQDDFQPLVVRSKGFRWRAERPDAPSRVEQKWGWSGGGVGDWAELAFDTRAGEGAPQLDARGKPLKANVWLTHLRSYEHMGVARVECRSGCRCAPTTLDSTWARRVSLQQIHNFKVSQHAECVVRVTIVDEAGEVPSDGHKVQLVALMVTHFPIRLSVYAQQVEDVAAQAVGGEAAAAAVGGGEQGGKDDGGGSEQGDADEQGGGSTQASSGSEEGGDDGRRRF